MDTAERKKTAEELRQSEELFRQVTENVPDAILIHCDGAYLYANHQALQLFGIASPEQLTGKPTNSIAHADSLEIVKAQLLHPEDAGVANPSKVLKMGRLDGTSFNVEIMDTYITYQGKAAVLVILRDITEQKRVEKVLSDKIAQLETDLINAKQLEGIVPICMYCKNIRGANKNWHQFEEFFSMHSEILFSHGICPECLEHNLSKMADN